MSDRGPRTTWITYVLRCADGTVYCGITTDLERRLKEHNGSPLGARYTRSRRPVEVILHWTYATRSEAARQEAWFKSLRRDAKEEVLASVPGRARKAVR